MTLFWILIALMILLVLVFLLSSLFFARKKDISTFNLILVLVILLPIISLSLYWYWGDSRQLKQTLQIKAEMKQLKNSQQVIVLLQKRLQQTPDSAKGWYLLGKIYFDMGEYTKAVQALTRAYQLRPNNINVMVQYVEALFFADKQHLNHQAQRIINNVLKQQPHNLDMINLLAINAYCTGNYKKAVAYWENLLQTVPTHSQDAKLLLQMIGKAHRKMRGER